MTRSFHHSCDEERRDILISDIQSLRYSSPGRFATHITGGFLIGASSLTLLLAAPLVSINYREGGFNSDRYFLWAGASLTGLAVGIPLTIFTRPKTYRLSNYINNTPCPNCWNLEKQPNCR